MRFGVARAGDAQQKNAAKQMKSAVIIEKLGPNIVRFGRRPMTDLCVRQVVTLGRVERETQLALKRSDVVPHQVGIVLQVHRLQQRRNGTLMRTSQQNHARDAEIPQNTMGRADLGNDVPQALLAGDRLQLRRRRPGGARLGAVLATEETRHAACENKTASKYIQRIAR